VPLVAPAIVLWLAVLTFVAADPLARLVVMSPVASSDHRLVHVDVARS
jgi:hypothetical protein